MRAAVRTTAADTVKLFISVVSAVSVAEGRLATVPGVTGKCTYRCTCSDLSSPVRLLMWKCSQERRSF